MLQNGQSLPALGTATDLCSCEKHISLSPALKTEKWLVSDQLERPSAETRLHVQVPQSLDQRFVKGEVKQLRRRLSIPHKWGQELDRSDKAVRQRLVVQDRTPSRRPPHHGTTSARLMRFALG